VQTIPPEKNLIYVICPVAFSDSKTQVRIENYAINPKSFDVPGFPPMADPEDPDYVGRCLPVYVIDPSLAGIASAGGDAYAATQRAVDFLTRRLYEFLCHAQRLITFQAPLAFIPDAGIGGNYRPLRFLDPITINGQPYLIRSVNTNYSSGKHQLAMYEAVQPIAS
jgi:hypothetical protein